MTVPDEFGITILKPSHHSVWSKWLLGKQNPDITPSNLRNRSWHDFPRVEVLTHTSLQNISTGEDGALSLSSSFSVSLCVQTKTPGPPFGTNMGGGLALREKSAGSAAQRQPVRSCPKVLEMREIYQHRPFTASFQNTVDTRLKVKRARVWFPSTSVYVHSQFTLNKEA